MSRAPYVAEILKRPVFKTAQLISGVKGINRQVRWVHILDIEHPSKMIYGEELILTTGSGFRRKNDALLQYVSELIEANASGLCVEIGEYIPEIPPAVTAMADQHHFPLIVFHTEVRFVDITKDLHEWIIHVKYAQSEQEQAMLQERVWVEQLISGDNADIMRSFTAVTHPLVFGVLAIGLPSHCLLNSATTCSIKPAEWFKVTKSAFKKFFRDVVVAVEAERIIVVLDRSNHFHVWESMVRDAWQQLQTLAAQHLFYGEQLAVGAGIIAQDSYSIAKSYLTAVEALAIQKKMGKENILFYERAGIYRYISLFTDNHTLLQMATIDLEVIENHDRKYGTDLLNTLQVFLDCDRSKQQTADLLYIHRQTLYHRLEQIRQLLGTDLNDPIQRLALHVAIYTRKFHLM
ncbi:PucR family transcriptional regulator [Sulfoacidibacillus thermotolerans]|uniref:PucR family transcriptional regulator n=1 Tax=Sulfoacidibacillus thermotolerans TaxID=1765684 RepID=A0A2U3D983_SULT2|nr:PucR family transcriptional regulator [Sulfoacidibacillus thermotolerans]PWI57839.1 hypothetical protein BM613_06540 [Sulfoacidibacillus thermotolerans]